MDKVPVQIDGHTLTLSNLTKVLYPADGFTKAEVLDYYQRISAVLLPHIAGRPMTLKRYPEGVDAESFFAKHAPAHRPDWIRTEDVESRSSRSGSPAPRSATWCIDDLAALIWAANLAGLELHVPMWRFPGRPTEPEPTCSSSTSTPGCPPRSWTAAGWRRNSARCSRTRACGRCPRPRAARACSCTRRSAA